ncbi:CAP domain-containing protein [Cylindrospermum sp. FACHB-282]|uniref:CAP domain-containing protein n=1 Tax=Cylindrospermum sp. FACHB-282 TaxID=2692794 RepID=UPI001689836E|nr:CAP domain-containing protein [Cylindrospermum sp. FACHB-282]MBD2388379.1 CAP domain-containing protein [Cylindrospermum sp. FACHB-282]
MKRKNLYSAAFGTLFLTSGAIAISAPGHTAIHKSSLVSKYSYEIAQSTVNTAAIEASVFEQINQYRASQGLAALTRNSAIDTQARTHSKNMASGQVPFGHNGFQQRVQATGISYSAAAENVAYNQGVSDPATAAVQGWLKSSGHLANIKGNYNLTGIGVASNSQGRIYFTQIFLRSK